MATAASVDTSANRRSERRMHGELADAASASAARWEWKANFARGQARICLRSSNREIRKSAEVWRHVAIQHGRIAASRSALAAHHRELSAG